MAGLPLLKLAGLLVKQIAKPLAGRLKIEAGTNPSFKSFVVNVGQRVHEVLSRANVLVSGYRVLKIKPLPEQEAMDSGITIISESLVYIVSGTIIVLEYNRSEEKNAKKAKDTKEKEDAFNKLLNERFQVLHSKIDEMDIKMKELEDKYNNSNQRNDDNKKEKPIYSIWSAWFK
eukprot:gene5329-7395_t